MDFKSLKRDELRRELKRRGLKSSGRKREMLSRLESFLVKQMSVQTRQRKRDDEDETVTASSRPSQATITSSLESLEDDTVVLNGGSNPHRNHNTHKDVVPRSSLVLWRHPILTMYYFILEVSVLTSKLFNKLWSQRLLASVLLTVFVTFLIVYRVPGPHQQHVAWFEKNLLWCAYWLGLGILSSVGLGTGLHTFLLYLGPHIAAVTLAAFECMSVDFPQPPYPDELICPDHQSDSMSVLTIMSKVRLEAFMWGAGTALGELPPYFMARAARLSGQVDEEEEELEELILERRNNPTELSFLDRAKVAVHDLVQRVGFVGILLCASIPNPLFDLAGITCGHFLIPFWTFFGATLIGKAIIKMHIQKLFVIFIFSEHHVEYVISMLSNLPYFGSSFQVPFKDWLVKQKANLHVKPGTAVAKKESLLARIFEKVVLLMVIFFIVSIINSMAQRYHKRIAEELHGKAAVHTA